MERAPDISDVGGIYSRLPKVIRRSGKGQIVILNIFVLFVRELFVASRHE